MDDAHVSESKRAVSESKRTASEGRSAMSQGKAALSRGKRTASKGKGSAPTVEQPQQPARPASDRKVGAVAVFGAGIAGMQASLDLAEMGFKVYLIDNKPCIGGTMAQLDKTFPTNDCAMCIMSPKLVDTGRHPNIELLTNTELTSLTGQAGAFHLGLKKKPRFIDELQCNGCGDCAEKCPVNVPSEHDEGIGERKAVYRRYPQAIPNLFAIDKRGTPPCRHACPAHVNVQGYIALISVGEYRKAYELVRERHPLPSVCGRICHHPCESACNRAEIDEPVAINHLKRFAADRTLGEDATLREGEDATLRGRNLENADKPAVKTAPSKNGARVAVIGAGPAGLTAASDLAAAGYAVTIFEREDKPGGALYTAIPGYRLDKAVLFREAGLVLDHPNIEVRYGRTIGKKKTLQQLKSEGFAAVFLATGAALSRDLKIPGLDAQGVLKGLEFLKGVNTGQELRFDGVVTVIGGGNVATDVARTARRLGSSNVRLVCLESRREMPAYSWEIAESLEEGIEILNGWSPREVLAGGGRVTAVRLARCTRVFDLEGRFNPTVNDEEMLELPTDTLIVAIGQAADPEVLAGLGGSSRIEPGPGNTVPADPLTLQTSLPWLFVGGDVVTGPASAVEAVASGHAAAESIRRFLEKRDLREGREPGPQKIAPLPEAGPGLPIEKKARSVMPVLEPRARVKGFQPFELGFDEKSAREEALRCLNCGVCAECLLCVEACGREAVNHLMHEQTIELDAGALILATGAERFDPSGLEEYGYRKYPNVITASEFERILSASGPFGGQVVRPSDRTEPRKIAWVLCAGSRQMKEQGQAYCSGICCMYSIKEAIIAKEHAEGVDCHLYYMDIRAYGKDFDAYYERARDSYGVKFRRARLSLIEEVPGGQDLRIKYVDEQEQVQEEVYDLVVLSTGLVAGASTAGVAGRVGVELNRHGFFDRDSLFTEQTRVPGIYVCGTASGPRNIPESVAAASASASYASALLKEERNTLVTSKSYPEELAVAEQEPRVGVFVCHCGINIGSTVEVTAVAGYAAALPGVVHAEANLYTCSQDTQEKIKQAVQEKAINRVVVASCTPRTHEALFQDTLREVGLNPFMFEFVGIREQCSWVHMKEKEKATAKARELVAVGVSRARLLSPYRRTSFSVLKKALVIGGGIAGITAALNLADQGFQTFLVEKEEELGGNLRDLRYTLDGRDVQAFLKGQIEKLNAHPLVTVFTGTKVLDVSGYVGNYRTSLVPAAEVRGPVPPDSGGQEIEHGVIIVATGAEQVRSQEYRYGESNAVLTQQELECRLAEAGLSAGNGRPGSLPRRVVMIQCVGSRESERPYCSRVCCQTAVKNALKIKELDPAAEVTVFYRDMRTYGFSEEHYQKARELGVSFLRYEPEAKPEVRLTGEGRPLIRYRNLLLGREEQIESDLLVLSTGMEPPKDASIARILKLPLSKDGFLMEAHAKLRPLDFPADGIYLCGAAHAPKTIAESISQAAGAAARAVTLLAKDEIQSSGKTVQINERICTGCGLCLEVCPYEARVINDQTGKAEIIEVLCQGCGACATACPNGATLQIGFTKSQVYHMLEEVV